MGADHAGARTPGQAQQPSIRPLQPGEPVHPARHADDPPRSQTNPGESRPDGHGPGTASAVVANPVKVKDGGSGQRQIRAALARAGWPAPLWLETSWEDPGGSQTRQAIQAGAEIIFACGGDGTVTACASELAGTDVALAVVPSGTGNLLAANLKLPADPAKAAAVATARGRRRLDVGMVESRCFTVMAG